MKYLQKVYGFQRQLKIRRRQKMIFLIVTPFKNRMKHLISQNPCALN